MVFITTYFNNVIDILLEMAPWLILGTLIAGIIHTLLPIGFIKRHLGVPGFNSILKAVIIGIPMPLCSCSVIPAALGIKKDGASTGATSGFLISTPQTGADSIMMALSFFGLPFVIFKILAALISGAIGGLWINFVDTKNKQALLDLDALCCTSNNVHNNTTPTCCHKDSTKNKMTLKQFLKDSFIYCFITMYKDFYFWLTIGILISALITTIVPPNELAGYWFTTGVAGLFLTLLISIPLYVCATESMPLAAALVTAGLSPGAALVFLMAGPVTNITTIGTVYKNFGKQVATIYVIVVVTISLFTGFIFDLFFADAFGIHAPIVHHDHSSAIAYVGMYALLILLALHFFLAFKSRVKNKTKETTSGCPL